MKELQDFVDNFGLGISKEQLASKAYVAMEMLGHEVWLINDRYLHIDDKDYQFIKSRKQDKWIVKDF